MTSSHSLPNRSAQSALRARRTHTFGYALAGLLGLAGLTGLIGEAQGIERLMAPLADWPRVRIVPSIALTALGLSLYGFLKSVRPLALWAATTAAALGVAGIIAYAGLIRLPDQGMALASAVMLTTAALALVLACLEGQPAALELYFGIAGFILVALSTAFLVARAAGMLDPQTDQLVAGASIQVVLSSLLLGAYFLGFIRSRGLPSLESARWLPAAVGIASLVTVLMLSRALATRENDQVLALTRQAAEGERRSLTQLVEVAAQSLRRAAEWKLNGATPTQQQRDVEALRRDMPGLDGAFWVSADGTPGRGSPSTLDVPAPDSIWPEVRGRLAGVPDTVVYVPLDSASRQFMILAPGCVGWRCSGAMVGMVGSAGLFHPTFVDTTRGFRFGISSGEGWIGGSPIPAVRESDWAQRLPLQLGAVRLTLTAWPTPTTLTRVRSHLPGLVLLLGLIVSGLLPVTLYLGQRARQNAREVERARLASAVERATDGIWEWDLPSGEATRSPGMWRYLGYDPAAIPRDRAAWTMLIHPDDRARVQQALEQHLSGAAGDFESEYRVRSTSGSWHTVVDRGRVVDRDPDGQPLRILGITADVTGVRAAQAAREMTDRRFRAIFDSGFQPKLLLDRDGHVIEVNRVALEARGEQVGAVRDRGVWDTLWWAGQADAQARLREAMATALTGHTPRYEEEVHDAEGAVTILDIAIKPIFDATGRPAQLLLEARDITARRRAEAALREVDTLTTMGRVAARVAHEINNPLAGIQNCFLLIKGAVPSTHPYFAYVGALEREIGRIAAVTRQLYETYRPEQDITGATSVRTVLGDAIAFLEQVNRAAQVRVETEFDGVPIMIPLASAMLRQIAYNLIQNAIEASPAGTTVKVRAGVRDRRLELRVRDYGPGVPPELRERIFEPFFSTKDKRVRTSGMGIGLALVRRTVTAAGGTITVADAEGGGSEFIVTLPLESSNGASA